MIKYIRHFLTIVVLGSVLVACEKSDDDNRTNEETGQVAGSLRGGAWRISQFKDDGVDRTELFTAYSFSFEDGNKLTVTEAGNTINGTWSVTLDDDRLNDMDLNLFFSNTATSLRMLNDDWDIISYTNQKVIVAEDYNDPDEDVIVFERL